MNSKSIFSKISTRTLRFTKKTREKFTLVKLTNLLSQFESDPDYPSSAGSSRQHLTQLILGSRNTYDILADIADSHGKSELKNIIIEGITFSQTESSQELSRLFDLYGSDKGEFHQYSSVYSELISQLGNNQLNILEIGLGTNNTDTLSNMGAHGSPGASLRAWRDFCPDAMIVGCDIDERILFSEESISTFHLDQTNSESWRIFIEKQNRKLFDLIIDDGLHSPMANLKTVLHAGNLLKPGGVLVIEDIAHRSLTVWKVLAHLIADSWDVRIVKRPHANLAIISRK
jgi:SAM-dependent methyltransferase